MAKARAIEAELHRLSELDLSSGEAIAALRTALQSRSNLVVARAARLVATGQFQALQQELDSAFRRLAEDGPRQDRGCSGRQAIAQALYELGIGSAEIFLAGIHTVQMEPSFGGAVDAAIELRGVCALGLVRAGYRDALRELGDLLMDDAAQARSMAARAIAYAGRPEGALLLRLKIRAGDREVDVLSECFTALLALDPRSLDLVGTFLSGEPELALAAALAIASSKLSGAGQLLRSAWRDRPDAAFREMLTLPIALVREGESIDLLANQLESGPTRLAAAAAAAVGIYRHDPAMRQRLLAAGANRSEPEVRLALAKALGESP